MPREYGPSMSTSWDPDRYLHYRDERGRPFLDLLARDLGLNVREEVLPFERLGEAAEMFLTGAVRGIEPVRGCDGVFTGSEPLITPQLSHALRQRWEVRA